MTEICAFCRTGQVHPLFLYVITDSRQGINDNNTSNNSPHIILYIGTSSAPEENVKCHNRDTGYRAAAKWTKCCAPYWQLEACIHVNDPDAYMNIDKLEMECKRRSRYGLKSVLLYLCYVSAKTQKVLLCRDEEWVASLYHHHNQCKVLTSYS